MKKSGSSFRYRSQRYWLDGTQAHETRDGRRVTLQRLYTRCPACGVGFHILATATATRARNLRRRCDACKHQGVPVEYRRPPKTRRKRPEGAAKGNPRPKLLRRPPAKREPVTQTSALVAAVYSGEERRQRYRDALGMLEPQTGANP